MAKILKWVNKFMNYYNKTYPELLNIHKTYTREKAMKYKSRSNGT